MEIHQVREEKDKHQLSILDMKACVSNTKHPSVSG